MRFVWLALFSLVASVTEALLLRPPNEMAVKHRMVLTLGSESALHPLSSRSSRTALFFKNSTNTNFDIDRVSNPMTTTQSKTIFANDGDETIGDNVVVSGFDDDCFPGRDENERFECHPSVAFWRNFQLDGSKDYSAQHNLREVATIAQKFADLSRGLSPASYFGRHVGRTAYFAMNAYLAAEAIKFFSTRNNDNNDNDKDNKLFEESEKNKQKKDKPFILNISSQIATRMVLESFLSYEQEYFQWIQKGTYREPWDMKSLTHRQSNPINVITQTTRFVREAVGTMGRRSRGTEQDKQVRFFQGYNQRSGTTADGEEGHGKKLYPKYYQTAFHYQGDGWMSTDSANVYETSTETLFLGRQDSMQRTTLPPVVALGKKFKNSNQSRRPMRILEVACGTGRFMTFVRDNLPLDTEYTAIDLSPFYLEKASDNDAYWRRTRSREELRQKSPRSSAAATSTISPANIVQAQAEALPFSDDSFDAVICVYLFHELPRNIRAKAAAEMARVVSPGGTVVLTDSIQKGDRPALDNSIGNFNKMNEPYYIDFVNDDLGAHFESQGLIPKTKIVRSTTKSLSFSKPGELSL